MSAATNKKGFSKQRRKLIEGKINQSKGGLVTTKAAANAFLKRHPTLEKLRTKPVEHANVRKICKKNNMDYSNIVFHCPVKNYRFSESLLFLYFISPLHHCTIHHCTI